VTEPLSSIDPVSFDRVFFPQGARSDPLADERPFLGWECFGFAIALAAFFGAVVLLAFSRRR
jgi:hypothetical protein